MDDGNGDIDEWVNLAQLAKICGGKPETIWSEHCFILLDIADIKDVLIIAGPRIPIATVKSDGIFYLDAKGNVLDQEGQRTGFCVNGSDGKNIGSWEQLFVPEEWAAEVLEENADYPSWEEMHPVDENSMRVDL